MGHRLVQARYLQRDDIGYLITRRSSANGHTTPEIQEEISKDPLFSKLLAANVTFLDDADFLSKAAELPKPPPDTGKIVNRMETRTMEFLPVFGV